MTPALQAWQDSEQPTPEEETCVLEMQRCVRELLATFQEKPRTVIEHRFGFDGRPEKTLKECGKLFGISPERTRQVEAKALRMMRHPHRSRVLRLHWYDLPPQSNRELCPHVDWDRAMRNALLWPIAFHQIRPWCTRPGWVGPTDEDRQLAYERDWWAVPQWDTIPAKHQLYYLRPSYDFALALTRREKHDRRVAFVEGVARRGVHFQDAAFHVWHLAGDKRIALQHRLASLSYLCEMWFEWIEWYVVDGGQKRRAGRLDLGKRGGA